jgi:hypothetical protein
VKHAVLLLVLALLCETATLDAFAWLCEAAYGKPRTVAEPFELPLTYAGLVVAGPLALLCALASIFLFWRRARAWLALPCIALLCFPALTVATLFTHVLGCVRNWW